MITIKNETGAIAGSVNAIGDVTSGALTIVGAQAANTVVPQQPDSLRVIPPTSSEPWRVYPGNSKQRALFYWYVTPTVASVDVKLYNSVHPQGLKLPDIRSNTYPTKVYRIAGQPIPGVHLSDGACFWVIDAVGDNKLSFTVKDDSNNTIWTFDQHMTAIAA